MVFFRSFPFFCVGNQCVRSSVVRGASCWQEKGRKDGRGRWREKEKGIEWHKGLFFLFSLLWGKKGRYVRQRRRKRRRTDHLKTFLERSLVVPSSPTWSFVRRLFATRFLGGNVWEMFLFLSFYPFIGSPIMLGANHIPQEGEMENNSNNITDNTTYSEVEIYSMGSNETVVDAVPKERWENTTTSCFPQKNVKSLNIFVCCFAGENLSAPSTILISSYGKFPYGIKKT